MGAAVSVSSPGPRGNVWRSRFPDGTTQTRYQQVVEGAEVLGGQITVLRDATGVTTVIGAHFAGLRPAGSVVLTAADALQVAADLLGAEGDRTTSMHIDPRSGSLHYEVETARFATRWILWVDAATGTVLNRFDAIAEGVGTGVKGDTKTIDTTPTGDRFQLQSADGRHRTDDDDIWDTELPLDPSPSQPPGVDAHYYANLVDDLYGDTYSRDSIDDAGMPIISTVHYDAGYCNAFWNGTQMTYGDGDGVNCLPLSGGLDVVGHELTHGVTEFTSGLIYENESGALNESFSDMMGNTAEFYAEQRALDPAAEPDYVTTPCIPTSIGSVQFVTDQAVVDQGFTVDAVKPC